MITKEEAIKKVRDTIPEDCAVMLDSVIEKEFGWVISYQCNPNTPPNVPLSGSIIVEKATGRTFDFVPVSAASLDHIQRIYELGYLQYDDWDIVIIKVINKRKTIKHLMKLGICYVVPVKEDDTVSKAYNLYTYRQIKRKLKSLPVRFNLGCVYLYSDCCEALESLKEQNDFEYQVFENRGYENSI